jgi:hypothetical protein
MPKSPRDTARYSIKLDERRDAKKAIYDALKEIEAERRCCE